MNLKEGRRSTENWYQTQKLIRNAKAHLQSQNYITTQT